MRPFDLEVAERCVVWLIFGAGASALAVASVALLAIAGRPPGAPPASDTKLALAVALGVVLASAVLGALRWRQLRHAPHGYWSPLAFRLAGGVALASAVAAIASGAASSVYEIALSAGCAVVAGICCFRAAAQFAEQVQAYRAGVGS